MPTRFSTHWWTQAFSTIGKHLRDVAHHQSNKDLEEQFTILRKCRGEFEIWNAFHPTKETSTQHCLTQLMQHYFVLSQHLLYSTIFRVLSASYLSNRPQNLVPTECYHVQCKLTNLWGATGQNPWPSNCFDIYFNINDLPSWLDIICTKLFVYIIVSSCTLAELAEAITSEHMNFYSRLKANKLSFDVAETEFRVIGSHQKLLADSSGELNIKLDNHAVVF